MTFARTATIIVAALSLFFAGGFFADVHARGGHGGGHGGRGGSHGGHARGAAFHGGYARGFHGTYAARHGGYYHRMFYGGRGSTYYRGGGTYVGLGAYLSFSPYGWYNRGVASYPEPWYFYEASDDDLYLFGPAPSNLESQQVEGAPQDIATAPGEWVEVPGQWVDGIWVPPHNALVPESP